MKTVLSLIFATVLSNLSGCVVTQPAASGDKFALPRTFDLLNSPSSHLHLGTIYIVRRNSLSEVLAVVDQRSFEGPGGWITTSESPAVVTTSLGTRLIGRLDGFCGSASELGKGLRQSFCPKGSPVTVSLEMKGIRTERLLQAFSVLEILNRPVSGIDYNRAADNRVMQWRVSLAEAIARNDPSVGEHVSLCTEIRTALSSALVVEGNVTAEFALAIARDVAASYGLEINVTAISTATGGRDNNRQVFPLVGFITSAIELRDIGLVDVSTTPQIDYRLGGVRLLEIRDQ